MEQTAKRVNVVLNALRVIEQLALEHPAGVSALSRALALPKSTVQRCLVTLADAGWVIPTDGESTKWQLSRKALIVGIIGTPDGSLREKALQHMRPLRDETGETVHLSVPEDTDIVVIGRLDSAHVLRSELALGTRVALHASAMGRAMLAFMAPAEIDRILAREHHQYTPATLMDDAEIRAELERVRAQGYAVNVSGFREGIASIAAPVFDHSGQPRAAISVTMPLVRFEGADVAALGRRVMMAAHAASDGPLS